MTLYDLKPGFQNLLRPVCRGLRYAGATPHSVTLFTLLLCLLAGFWLAFSPGLLPFAALPVILFVRMALNAIDGMMAKEFNMTSRVGAVLNEAGDIIADIALYLPFGRVDLAWRIPVAIVVGLSVGAELAGIAAARHGKRSYAGPVGKSDRALIFGVISLFVYFRALNTCWGIGIWSCIAAGLVLTIVNRLRPCPVKETA